jgi:hypothetical protein
MCVHAHGREVCLEMCVYEGMCVLVFVCMCVHVCCVHMICEFSSPAVSCAHTGPAASH